MQCDYFDQDRCRSCSWLARPYADQLAEKNAALHALLDVYHPQAWFEPVASPETGFRHKAKMAVLGSIGAPLLGIVNHKGAAISLCDCPLYPVEMRQLLHRLERWIGDAGLPPYQVDRRCGELKFLLLTRSRSSGEYMLRFVLRSEQAVARIKERLPALLGEFPAITVISANIQPVHMAILEGDKEIFLGANTRLREQLNDVPLYIRPKSFFQTNPEVAAALYRTARAWAADNKPARIWDLFCGVGGFGLHCAAPGTALTGIEIEPEAIACARQSAAELGLSQVSFGALDATGSSAGTGAAPDLVIVNPPRRGIGAALCRRLVDLAPPRILYSSCNPQTLAGDLSRIPGYRLARVRLFDMFPHTSHFEVLVELARPA